ncbi:ankyrin repeat protein [Trichoderma velutinum]
MVGRLSNQDCSHDKAFLTSLKLLVQNGLKLGSANEVDGPLWTIAIHQGSLESLRYLIEGGVNVNEPYQGQSPLMHATHFGKTECARVLLDKGARIDWRDASGESALFKAAAEQNFEIADFLLNRGADPSETGLLDLCLNSPQIMRKVLELFPKPNTKDKDGFTPICNAAASCQLEAIKILVEFGAEVDIETPNGNTPLIELVKNDHPDVVRCLLGARAEVKFQGRKRSPALHYAKTVEMINILIKNGADVNMADADGDTALHYQVRASSFNLLAIQRLITAGANINAKNIAGITPLIESIGRNRLLLVDYLLSEGADPHNAEQLSESALYYACYNGNANMVRLLFLAGAGETLVFSARGGTPLHAACLSDSDDQGLLEVIQYLVEVTKVNVNQVCGRNALHWAAQGGNVDIVRRILDQPGVAINETDLDGWTALCWAARGSSPDWNSQANVVKLLLEKGADKSVRVQSDGDEIWTPLEIAIYHETGDDVIQLLTEEGRLNSSQKRGLTLIDTLCRGCGANMYGIRRFCLSCEDFELCSKCFSHRKAIHVTDHEFDSELPPPDDGSECE